MGRVLRVVFGSVVLAWSVAMGASLMAQAAAPAQGSAAVPAEAKKMKAAFPSSPAAIEAGKNLYGKYCRFCHGDTGKGDGKMAPKNVQPADLTDETWTRGSSEGEIFWIIQNGAPPKFEMKGIRSKITAQETWNLVHFVRSLGGVPK